MKKAFVACVFLLLGAHALCPAAGRHTNARLVNYAVGRYDHNYFLLIPDNLSRHPYLAYHPFTAFMFLKNYDEEKISQLTVKELNSGSLGSSESSCAGPEYFEVLKFDKIKGFEKMAAELDGLDEFGIADRKPRITSALLHCFAEYKKDYDRYLRGNDGPYRFRKGQFGFLLGTPMKEYNETVEINEKESPSAFYDQIDKRSYDFDRKLIKIDPLSPYSKRSSSGWEYHYIQKYKAKYRDKKYKENSMRYHRDFPETIDVPLTIDDAKKLFAENDRVFSETVLTVTPSAGYFGYSGVHFFVMTSNFDIQKVTKNFYKREQWSHEEKGFWGTLS